MKSKSGSPMFLALLLGGVMVVGCAAPTKSNRAKADAAYQYGSGDDSDDEDQGGDASIPNEGPDAGVEPWPEEDGGTTTTPPPTMPPTAPPPACTVVLPVDAKDVSSNTDNACQSLRTLAVDNLAAGLDLVENGELVTYGGRPEAGCIRVDFGSSRMLDPIAIYRRAVSQACSSGRACEGEYCGTGNLIDVFRGNAENDNIFVNQYTVGDRDRYGRQLINLGTPTRYIMVCRPGTGSIRDDIEIDAVTGCAH